MDEDKVPAIDVLPENDQTNDKQEQLEFELLQLEAHVKQFQRSELRQRYWLRWLAVALGLIVIVFMAFVMGHQLHRVFFGPFLFANSAFSVAFVVGPVFSIAAITIVFFVAAFRRFEDSDMETISSGVVGGASVFKGI
jgi:uncharacterized membrane protein YhaH (DUF805 family)